MIKFSTDLRFYLLLLYILSVLILSPSFFLSYAQEIPIESCFSYYDYGKIKADLSPDKQIYTGEEIMKLRGAIINNNTFPLVDVVLYAQLRRLNEDGNEQQYGHYFIDKLILKEGLNFLVQDKRAIEVSFPVKSTYPNGKYRIQYYLMSKETFHYGGRPFLEEDFGGSTDFTIAGNDAPLFYFDPTSLKVNGEPHRIKEQIFEFTSKPISFELQTIDRRTTKNPVQAKVKLYSFEDTFEDKLVTQTQVEVKPNTSITFSFSPPEAGAYVIVIETTTPQQSILKYRFAYKVTEASTLRMNDLGITDFPVTSNSRAWVCFHSPTPENSARTTITLSLLSDAQTVIDQVSVTDSFDGEVRAISLPLTKLANKTSFWIEGVFSEEGNRTRSRPVRMHYDCSQFPGSLKSLDLRHDKSSPGELIIDAKTSCGTKISQTVGLDAIRIRSGDTIVKEDYNMVQLPEKYSLGTLAAGSYTADLKVGNLKKSLEFTLISAVNKPSTPEKLSRKNVPSYVLPFIGIIIVALIGWLYIKRKNNY